MKAFKSYLLASLAILLAVWVIVTMRPSGVSTTVCTTLICFQDVTEYSGIRNTKSVFLPYMFSGKSQLKKSVKILFGRDERLLGTYGAYWGEFNGDSYPDLWLGAHYTFVPALYVNTGEGAFRPAIGNALTDEQIAEVLREGIDFHGAAWADFDNDGDQDLIQTVGAARGLGTGDKFANWFFVNDGETLRRAALDLGLNNALARSRTPTWFDLNNDGLLDIFIGRTLRRDSSRASSFFRSTGAAFQTADSELGVGAESGNWALLADVSGDHRLDVIFPGSKHSQILDFWDKPPIPVLERMNCSTADLAVEGSTSAAPCDLLARDIAAAADVVAADLNGDLAADLIVARGHNYDEVYQVDHNRVIAWVAPKHGHKSIYFRARGELLLRLGLKQLRAHGMEVYTGLEAARATKAWLTMDPRDQSFHGYVDLESATADGIYVGFDDAMGIWRIAVLTAERAAVDLAIQSKEVVEIAGTENFESDRAVDSLWMSSYGTYRRAQLVANQALHSMTSVVAADFDNDMDLDLYGIASGSVSNRDNLLLENDGSGNFHLVANAGGAAGTEVGRGDTVSSADFDVDGFVDIITTNSPGGDMKIRHDTPYQMFRNKGNTNNWLEIDLVGRRSNRDGIGASVIVSAGGKKQLREQSGGMHRAAQNHQRLHFGLGSNNVAEEIIVMWPTGRKQILHDVTANQLIEILEPEDSAARP